jgi:hypothetical protein
MPDRSEILDLTELRGARPIREFGLIRHYSWRPFIQGVRRSLQNSPRE